MSQQLQEAPKQKNPLEDQEGLSPEQNQKLVELRGKWLETIKQAHKTRSEHFTPDYRPGYAREMRDIGSEIREAVDVRRAKRAGKKFDEKHMDDYPVQAVKDYEAEMETRRAEHAEEWQEGADLTDRNHSHPRGTTSAEEKMQEEVIRENRERTKYAKRSGRHSYDSSRADNYRS